MRIRTCLKWLGQKILNAVFPPRCAICQTHVQEANALCPDCFSSLLFITRPYCERCGYPFAMDFPEGALCSFCLRKKTAFSKARAAIHYDDAIKHIILPFKHADRPENVHIIVKLMMQIDESIWDNVDYIIPVPLHPKRLRQRKYNQAAIIAKAFGKIKKVPVMYTALKRVQDTPSQGHKNMKLRKQNVLGAFIAKETVRGKRIMLVDDVMTTGATINACAKALKKSGATDVRAIVFARVVLE